MLKKVFKWLLVLALILIVVYIWNHRFGDPEDFVVPSEEYKYGSIGSDHPMAQAPIPYWIWKVLPKLAPPEEVIPKLNAGPWNGKSGYEAFGLVTEAEMPHSISRTDKHLDRPIGFSRRSVFGMDFVGVNCAFCHLTTLKRTPEDEQQIILAGTGNTVNIEQYFLYLFEVLGDKTRFKAPEVMVEVDKELARQGEHLGLLQRLIFRYLVIPWVVPAIVADRKTKYFDWIIDGSHTRLENFGPGRVDTWALYKRMFVDPPQKEKVDGIVDFPAFWNQRAHEGMQMHWDGNIAVAEERNIISALSVIGKNIEYLDLQRVNRIADFANGFLPPRFEDQVPEDVPGIQRELVDRGQNLFEDRCAACHAPGGDRLGRVEPIGGIDTDTERLRDFSPELAAALNKLKTSEWKLQHFKPQHGYLNNLLDGIWLRSPYLHNGSVPTLRDLLKKPEQRPRKFCRGNNVFDWEDVGFQSTPDIRFGKADCGEFFLYDTAVSGNSNRGHLHGTDLSDADKQALLEFLKIL